MIDMGSNLDWLEDRACKDEDVSSFFPEPNVPLEPRIEEMCRSCPVREQCILLAYALPQNAGHFGLMSRANRQQISKEEAVDLLDEGKLDDRIAEQSAGLR